MATTKRRVNITADPDVEETLIAAAKRDGVPVAAKAAELLRIALAFEEDLALASLASFRDKKGLTLISHEDAWK